MRINGKDIGMSSRLWTSDHEGRMLIKERSDSIFRKSITWETHWTRLKGNILVILKNESKDSSEVYGIAILENFSIEIYQEKEVSHSFKIVFESDDQPIECAAYSLDERDEWISRLHNASMLSIREHMENVRNWIHSKTGQDPLEMPYNDNDDLPIDVEDQSVSGLELRFSCTNLPPVKKGSSRFPNYCIIVSLLTPPDREWSIIGFTENESEGNPTFMKTVFISSDLVCKSTKVRFLLVDVVDVNLNRKHTITSVTVDVEDLRLLSTHEFRLAPTDGHHFSVLYVRVCTRQPISSVGLLESSRLTNMKAICDNILPKFFAFPGTPDPRMIDVVELLGESLLNSSIPIEYLKQVIQKERLLYDSLNSCHVPSELGTYKTQRLESAKHCMMNYEMALKNTCDHPGYCDSGITFRPSIRRRETAVEYMPLNLHVHRTCVLNANNESETVLDVTTVGCFAASSRKFKNGGLLKMLERYEMILNDTLVEKCFTLLNKSLRLKNRLEDNLNSMVGQLCGGSNITVNLHRQKLRKRFDQFVYVSEDPIFNDTVSFKTSKEIFDSLTDILGGMPNNSESGISSDCINVINEVNEELIKTIASEWSIANDFLWARIIKRIGSMNSDFDDYHYRLHIVTSQGLTAALTALMAAIPRWTDKEWHQMSCCGVLVHFEGLLSCFRDEQGMIEDMVMAIRNLKEMELHFYPCASSLNDIPRLTSMNIVRIPCSETIWNNIPDELRVSGKLVLQWHLVFVNVGINEQQTLAERCGRPQLQERINIEAHKVMKHYFDLYCHNMGGLPKTKSNSDLCDILANIGHGVNDSHTSKPVHLLKNFHELTWALNGIRLTSCKSAKDRTAMSITLEQMEWLISRHGLKQDYLQQGLDCLRSTGLRRENTLKNVGCRKYAFTKVQLKCYPKIYRPPQGTYGHVQT